MRILIVDQCSGSKAVEDRLEPIKWESIQDNSRETLVDRPGVPSRQAKDLYAGQQQVAISAATEILRDAGDTVDRLFISAGFGLVEEQTLLPYYDATFSELSPQEIVDRSTELSISDDLINYLCNSDTYELIFFALGSDYIAGIDFETVRDLLTAETWLVLFNQEEIPADEESLISLPARNGEASRQGTNVIALKGKLIKNFAEHRKKGYPVNSLEDVIEYCMESPSAQSDLTDYS